MAAPDAPEPIAMKKLFLLLTALLCLGLAGCDQEYRNHRAERGKPKISVSEGMVTVRRPPAPNIIILADGTMKMDEIQIPLDDGQKQMLQTMFGKLQVLRQSGATLAHYQQRGRSETAYSGMHSSGFALGKRGFYWSGSNGADAGLAVQVADTDDVDLRGVAAELQVGGLRRQRLQIGERRLLPLSSYQSHRAEVQDASTLDSIAAIRVTGVGGARPMFLSPGRLMRMPVPIEVTYTFIGNAKDLAGAPLGGARILNAPVPGTSANGGFVADFPRRETTLYLLQDDRLLHCPLQVRERRQVVLLVGAVHCEPLAVAQLPAEIRQQARVTRLLQERALIAATPQTAAAGGTP